MCVNIDKAGRYDLPLSVNFIKPFTVYFADLADNTVVNSDVSLIGLPCQYRYKLNRCDNRIMRCHAAFLVIGRNILGQLFACVNHWAADVF